ncbi:hypothetical protein PHLCEN_2v5114 [Hermanssonia centrifuga]|uniref:Uncharacterized protein n=1 Tax=Hermanssonia centrifuga TaxID=98765 RepID=A0A2R6PBU8_9APHY|nr:hypothetical protein PHLCEN_2v5114 [Hermanssonia centrifuga]
MSEQSSTPDGAVMRPPPTRNPTAPSRTVAGLLANRRPMASTPIPPSLQAKMAAVRA